MKKQPKKHGLEIKRIKWLDAVANNSWFYADDMVQWANRTNCVIDEIGFIVADHKDYIVFATSIKSDDGLEPVRYGGLHKIPRQMVISEESL